MITYVEFYHMILQYDCMVKSSNEVYIVDYDNLIVVFFLSSYFSTFIGPKNWTNQEVKILKACLDLLEYVIGFIL